MLKYYLIRLFIVSLPFCPFNVKADVLFNQIAGEYVSSTYIIELLAKSNCSYIFQKSYSYSKSVQEVKSYLNDNDKRKFERWAFSNKTLESSEAIYASFKQMLTSNSSIRLDEKTKCGLFAGAVLIQYKNSLAKWNAVIDKR